MDSIVLILNTIGVVVTIVTVFVTLFTFAVAALLWVIDGGELVEPGIMRRALKLFSPLWAVVVLYVLIANPFLCRPPQ